MLWNCALCWQILQFLCYLNASLCPKRIVFLKNKKSLIYYTSCSNVILSDLKKKKKKNQVKKYISGFVIQYNFALKKQQAKKKRLMILDSKTWDFWNQIILIHIKVFEQLALGDFWKCLCIVSPIQWKSTGSSAVCCSEYLILCSTSQIWNGIHFGVDCPFNNEIYW